MFASARHVLIVGNSRHVVRGLLLSLFLGLCAGAASVGLLALSGWFIAMSALAGAGLAVGFSFFYASAGVQALAFGRTVLRYLERLVGHGATVRLDAALKESVFATVVAPSSAGAEAATTGSLLHIVTSDAEVAEASLLRVFAPVVTFVGVSIGGCCVIATVSLALASLVVLGCLAMAVAAILPPWVAAIALGRRLAATEMAARQEITDAVDGMDELLSFGAETLGARRVENSLEKVETAQTPLRGLVIAATTIRTAVAGGTILLVGAVGSGSLGNRPVALASAAAITLAAMAILQLGEPLATAAQEFGRSRAIWSRLCNALLTPPTIPLAGDEGEYAPGSVLVDELSINRGRGMIIDRLSLRASPGDTVVVSGPSGAGKTTLLAALSGQVPVQSGHARVSGTTVRLPQHPYVFRGTVADNLLLADPAASREQMQDALVMVGLNDILGASALDCRIGMGGRALSGGQKRRLSIAQAIIAQPDVILADELTEGLDATAASELLLALRRSDPKLTLVLALHDKCINQFELDAPDGPPA